MDAERLGEFSGLLIRAYAERKGVEFGPGDYAFIADKAVSLTLAMHERAEFARSVVRDLKEIETVDE